MTSAHVPDPIGSSPTVPDPIGSSPRQTQATLSKARLGCGALPVRARPRRSKRRTTMSQNGTRPCRVLIAGDSEELRPLLASFRQRKHFALLQAQDGPEALLFLRQGVADVAVLDLAILRVDGTELLQEVRGRVHP